ncbi:hypothetical protein ACFX2I_031434 [Malus domestica]
MTSNIHALSQVNPYNGDETITIGNGEGLAVKNIGSSTIINPTNTLTLHNVLHVPQITVNLLYVKKLCHDNGCWFICDDVDFFIQDKATRVILYQGMSDDRELFKIPATTFDNSFATRLSRCAAFLGQKVRTAIWHQRLGHPSEEILARMLKATDITISKDSCPNMCTSCVKGKMCRQVFPVRQNKAKCLFEKVHSDVWGPSQIQYVEGYKYYITFVDEFSRFMWIFPMINKSEACSIFVKFTAFVFNQFNTSIKCFQSDGGGEYMSKEFKGFLASKGISHMISCPYTPQQNGIAERRHRHVVETAITLMTEANLPQIFWYHACSHAVFLINRMPSQTLEFKSPYQLLFGKTPEIHNFKVFGTAIYPLLRPYTVNKFQARSSLCVFLGYAFGIQMSNML